MRIECGSIDEFLDELETEAEANRVWKGIIRWRVDREPEQEEMTTFQIAIFATALIGPRDSVPEYLLQVAALAGYDRSKPLGTEQAEVWLKDLQAVADKHELTIRKGRYELF